MSVFRCDPCGYADADAMLEDELCTAFAGFEQRQALHAVAQASAPTRDRSR
jgi:hypothetical protein